MIDALCKSLKESRIHYGLTQKEIANKLRVSQSTYAGYETGKSTPNIEMLCKLADIYGTSLDILIGRYIKN
jgi:transcriptional regulator with XRE-family HTH domain